MPTLTDNKASSEYSGATQQRELAQARQDSKRASELAVAAAHRAPGGGPKASAQMKRGVTQDGKINPGG